jgi:hypothetical protein
MPPDSTPEDTPAPDSLASALEDRAAAMATIEEARSRLDSANKRIRQHLQDPNATPKPEQHEKLVALGFAEEFVHSQEHGEHIWRYTHRAGFKIDCWPPGSANKRKFTVWAVVDLRFPATFLVGEDVFKTMQRVFAKAHHIVKLGMDWKTSVQAIDIEGGWKDEAS